VIVTARKAASFLPAAHGLAGRRARFSRRRAYSTRASRATAEDTSGSAR